MTDDTRWHVYRGTPAARATLPASPPWRTHDTEPITYDVPPAERDDTYQPHPDDITMINAALHLRRPLLVTGTPGSGKSSLARSVAHDLALGRVLVWPINSRSTLDDALYRYDALARLHDSGKKRKQRKPIGRYLKLGPLGTALLPRDRPRVLLVDEIDKSDLDLPNDLLHVFERGSFDLPELARAEKDGEPRSVTPHDSDDELEIEGSRIECRQFPLMILTSNGEREFPPAFRRRCLPLDMTPPDDARLRRIIAAHFPGAGGRDPRWDHAVEFLLERFLDLRDKRREVVATDQLLNALHLVRNTVELSSAAIDAVLRGLQPRS